MSAFSTISALRRRRPEDLPEGNAAAGGGLQGVACRERLAGGGLAGGALQGAPCRERLAGSALQGAPCRERHAGGGCLAGGASQGAPRRGRWRTATPSEGCSRFWLSAPTRSGPLRPDQSGHRATFRPLLPSGHLSASVCCSAAGASPPSGPPALRRCPAASARPQPRNHAATQPPQPLSHAKRALPAWGEPFCIGMASCAYPRNESRIPAATAEPTTPATLGPMACISR